MIWTLAFIALAFIQAACFGFLFACDRSDFAVFDSNRKVGGIRFLRIGRLQVSICLTRKHEAL